MFSFTFSISYFVLILISIILIAVTSYPIRYIVKKAKFKIKSKKHATFINDIQIPTKLGVHRNELFIRHADKLNASLSGNYLAQVRNRYIDEHGDKIVSEKEYNLLVLELSRYFYMCSLLKEVPMFSEKVDDIWHEMLMFTNDYYKFTHSFTGSFIHHIPVELKEPQPNKRAFFDLMYSVIFEHTHYSHIAWGNFFRNPLNKKELEQLKSSTAEQIKKEYFKSEANDELVYEIIKQIKYIINSINLSLKFTINRTHYNRPEQHTKLLMTGMIFYTLYPSSDYGKSMAQNDGVGSSSGCVYSGCSNCSSSCGGGGCGSS